MATQKRPEALKCLFGEFCGTVPTIRKPGVESPEACAAVPSSRARPERARGPVGGGEPRRENPVPARTVRRRGEAEPAGCRASHGRGSPLFACPPGEGAEPAEEDCEGRP